MELVYSDNCNYSNQLLMQLKVHVFNFQFHIAHFSDQIYYVSSNIFFANHIDSCIHYSRMKCMHNCLNCKHFGNCFGYIEVVALLQSQSITGLH